MTKQKKRPRRRCVFRQAFDHGGLKCIATVNCYPDSRPEPELVLRPGSAADVSGHWDAAAVTGLALQFGVRPDFIKQGLRYLAKGGIAFSAKLSLWPGQVVAND
jgi:hypothetical protein